MNTIEQYKTITLMTTIDTDESGFTKNIYVEFIPDEIVLKYVSYAMSAESANVGCFQLSSNLITNDMVVFTAPYALNFHESYNIPFPNYKRTINGTYLFELKTMEGNLIELDVDLNLAFTLVFIKWKN